MLKLINSFCKTRVFPLMVLVFVRLRRRSSCMSGLFCHILMYDMSVRATTLLFPGAWRQSAVQYVVLAFAIYFYLSRV